MHDGPSSRGFTGQPDGTAAHLLAVWWAAHCPVHEPPGPPPWPPPLLKRARCASLDTGRSSSRSCWR
ncbi:Hypothetical protein AA314_08408 [Archangium gephyra]|uniref:Uncharacterized protein n=1 Tax=Archangium gephyra TaxID=48 RepID=A0AAC8TI05_9BACT|nr:Hypothetical protein AA314_08408 [Archangium gephyra]